MLNAKITNEQLDFLFKNSRDFVFFMKQQGTDFIYLYTNAAAREMLGSEGVGQMVRTMTSEKNAKIILENYQRALKEQQQLSFQDYTYQRAEVKKHETTVTPITQNGEHYILAMTKEIKFDRDIQDKYLFMRSVFFNSFLSTVVISDELEVLEANPQFMDDFDVTTEEVKGYKFFELSFIDPEIIDQVKTYLQQAKKGFQITSKLITFFDREEQKRHFIATFSPLTREDEVIAIFIILQDITPYVKQREMLRVTSNGLDTFHRAMNAAADVTFTDAKGKITEVNGHFLKSTGFSREEIIGQSFSRINSRIHDPVFFQEMWSKIGQGQVWRGELCNRKKSGELYWVDTTIIPMTNTAGEIDQYISLQYNISEKKLALSVLEDNARTFRMITENTNDFIIILNDEGLVQYASPSYARRLGYQQQELLNRPYRFLLQPDSMVQFDTLFEGLSSAHTEGKLDLELRVQNGDSLWTEGYFTISQESVGQPQRMIMISREITERKELENHLRYMAYHDSLTQLPNRRYLEKEFSDLLAAADRAGQAVALIYLDGDNFKAINDRFGHDLGDAFLKNFGRALVKSVRSNDMVVRIGGDEFIIVVNKLAVEPDRRLQQIEEVIQRVRENLQMGWYTDGHHFTPTSSMGIAFYPEHARQLDELIEIADHALYKAKQSAKNNYKIVPFSHS